MRTKTLKIPRLLIDSVNRRDAIPEFLLTEATSLSPSRVGPDYEIDVTNLGSRNVVCCGATCSWHDDDCIADYSAILVIRNDAGSFVQVQQGCKPVQKDQPVGTFIRLDVRKSHRLWHPDGKRAPQGVVWAAVAIDYLLESRVRRYQVENYPGMHDKQNANEKVVAGPPTIDECWRDMECYLREGYLPDADDDEEDD